MIGEQRWLQCGRPGNRESGSRLAFRLSGEIHEDPCQLPEVERLCHEGRRAPGHRLGPVRFPRPGREDDYREPGQSRVPLDPRENFEPVHPREKEIED